MNLVWLDLQLKKVKKETEVSMEKWASRVSEAPLVHLDLMDVQGIKDHPDFPDNQVRPDRKENMETWVHPDSWDLLVFLDPRANVETLAKKETKGAQESPRKCDEDTAFTVPWMTWSTKLVNLDHLDLQVSMEPSDPPAKKESLALQEKEETLGVMDQEEKWDLWVFLVPWANPDRPDTMDHLDFLVKLGPLDPLDKRENAVIWAQWASLALKAKKVIQVILEGEVELVLLVHLVPLMASLTAKTLRKPMMKILTKAFKQYKKCFLAKIVRKKNDCYYCLYFDDFRWMSVLTMIYFQLLE